VDRRRFLQAVGASVVAAPVVGAAQSTRKIPRVGILTVAPPERKGGDPVYHAFREALGDLGYVDRKTMIIEFRFASGRYERLPSLAAELVGLPVDVIVTDGGDLPARAALEASKTIPVVMVSRRTESA
jgi:putative ABC transport system substrate-binding protein